LYFNDLNAGMVNLICSSRLRQIPLGLRSSTRRSPADRRIVQTLWRACSNFASRS